ncbi:MAG: NYN domain-containing protein [Spirochaetales bacterium]|nr:NYN domain-containing protein [Spirochaetales bacterium]
MGSDLIKSKNTNDSNGFKALKGLANGVIYVDYENIYKRLQDYGKNIIELNLVKKMKQYFLEKGINVVDFIIYANFDEKDFHTSYHQTYLQGLGVATKHTPNNGKNSSDIQLVVDAMKSLYTCDIIDVFIVLSSDRDMLPLIQAIKQASKITYLITTRTGFERSMMNVPNFHEYIEDILGLSLEDINRTDSEEEKIEFNDDDLESAKDIISLLISSKIWDKFIKRGKPINFEEYKKHVIKVKRLLPEEIDRLFKIAEMQDWIRLYKFTRDGMQLTGIRAGDKLDEVLASDIFKERFN